MVEYGAEMRKDVVLDSTTLAASMWVTLDPRCHDASKQKQTSGPDSRQRSQKSGMLLRRDIGDRLMISQGSNPAGDQLTGVSKVRFKHLKPADTTCAIGTGTAREVGYLYVSEHFRVDVDAL